MNVLMVNLDIDCAGVSWSLRCAMKDARVPVKHVLGRSTYAASNTDVLASSPNFTDLVRWADVVHFNHKMWGKELVSYLRGKRVVYHLHGGAAQLDMGLVHLWCDEVGAGIVACDPITALRENVTWLPNVVDVKALPGLRLAGARLAVAIMGSVSDERRNNQHIRKCLNSLVDAGYEIECQNFGDVPRDEALRQRAHFNLSVDNLTQGFIGMWSWESLMMGQPVLARLSPIAVSAYEQFFGKCPPVLQCDNADDIVWWVRRLYDNPAELDRWTSEAISWSGRMNPSVIVQSYLKYYRSLA